MQVRKAWVEEKEKLMVFGNGKTWMDIEADEVTFNSTDLKDLADDSNRPVIWEQWSAIAQRGWPDTWSNRLQPKISAKRAPGPGAIRKVEWKPLAKKHLKHRCVILHADAAKSYRLRTGVLYVHVRHCKKGRRSTANGPGKHLRM